MNNTVSKYNLNKGGIVSVIMPCYNAEKYLIDAIDSVFNQSYKSIELIVIDDGSSDSSLSILQDYANRIILIEQENQGPDYARNRGIAASNGDFIAFLDADDYWAPDFIAKLLQSLIKENADIAYCGWQNIGLPEPRNKPYIPKNFEQMDKAREFLRAAAPWPIHAALVRKNLLTEAKGFDVGWKTCEDYDLWLRIAVSHKLALVPEVLAFYRHEHNPLRRSSNLWQRSQDTWRIKKKFIAEHSELVSHVTKKELKELINKALLQRGYDALWNGDLISSQKIFRTVFFSGGWSTRDLKYILPSLLPSKFFVTLAEWKNN